MWAPSNAACRIRRREAKREGRWASLTARDAREVARAEGKGRRSGGWSTGVYPLPMTVSAASGLVLTRQAVKLSRNGQFTCREVGHCSVLQSQTELTSSCSLSCSSTFTASDSPSPLTSCECKSSECAGSEASLHSLCIPIAAVAVGQSTHTVL